MNAIKNKEFLMKLDKNIVRAFITFRTLEIKSMFVKAF